MCRVGADQTSGRGPALAWQEELRKLDEELASGRITAENYRIRRDAVLASAATSPQGPPGAAESTAMIPPVTGNAPPPSNADRTQVVSTGDAADKTQVVSGNAMSNSDRTQAVRPGWNQQQPQGGWGQQIPGVPQQQGMRGMPPSPPHGVPQQNPPQQQQSWESGGGDTGTPWGGSEFPPLNYGTGNQDWIKQGPEVFGESSGGSKKWLIIVVVVVVVLGLGAGGYFLFFNKPSSTASNGGSTSSSTAAPTSKPKPVDPLAIAQLPGTPQDQSGIQNFNDVVQAQLLTTSELNAYQTEGATKAHLATSTLPDGDHLWVMTAQVNSPTAAGTAVTTLVALQQTNGMQPFTGSTPAGVQATQIGAAGSTPNTIRAHYASKNVVVRVQVFGPSDMSTITQEFNQLIAAQVKLLAPNA